MAGPHRNGMDREGGHTAHPVSIKLTLAQLTKRRPSAGSLQNGKVGGAGPREAGGPHGPRPRQRVGSQGGMPTRSPPEAGLAGDELRKSPLHGYGQF